MSEDFCLSCSLLYSQCLKQNLAHSRYSTNTCQRNECILVVNTDLTSECVIIEHNGKSGQVLQRKRKGGQEREGAWGIILERASGKAP